MPPMNLFLNSLGLFKVPGMCVTENVVYLVYLDPLRELLASPQGIKTMGIKKQTKTKPNKKQWVYLSKVLVAFSLHFPPVH